MAANRVMASLGLFSLLDNNIVSKNLIASNGCMSAIILLFGFDHVSFHSWMRVVDSSFGLSFNLSIYFEITELLKDCELVLDWRLHENQRNVIIIFFIKIMSHISEKMITKQGCVTQNSAITINGMSAVSVRRTGFTHSFNIASNSQFGSVFSLSWRTIMATGISNDVIAVWMAMTESCDISPLSHDADAIYCRELFIIYTES